MYKIFTGCLSLFVVLAIAKVLLAQPMMAATGNNMITGNAMGNEVASNVVMMNDDMGMH